MQKIISMLVLFFPLVLCAQAGLSLGKGILKIDINKLPVLFFYSDTIQNTGLKTIEIIRAANGELSIKNASESGGWFKPEQLFFEYDIFMLRVENNTGNWLRVYTDNEKGITMWTKTDVSQRFIEWPKFLLKEVSAVDKNPSFELDIKASPDESSKTIKKIEATDCFEVLEIKGEWMHIKTNLKAECNESKKVIKSGWIKWKLNNKLAISYSLMA